MADDDQEKTHEPSDKRKEEFRDEGKIPKSMEINSLFSVFMGFCFLYLLKDRLSNFFLSIVEMAFYFDDQITLDRMFNYIKIHLWDLSSIFALFFLGIYLVAIVTSLSQTGINASSKVLEAKLENFNPVSGIQRVFSIMSLVQFIKNFFKLIIIGWILYSQIKDQLPEVLRLSDLPMLEAVSWSLHLISVIVIRIALFLAVISGLDYLYQWYQIHQQMMMSHQEIKDEMKDSQSSPHVKSQVRKISQERSKKQIRKEVPSADVIVTNPTHFSIAIRYDRNKDNAPRVVAKGQDYLAKIIREIAKENDVPLYEYPELARGLYKKVKVGQKIPGEFYQAVAQVLAYVYQIYRKRHLLKGKRSYVG